MAKVRSLTRNQEAGGAPRKNWYDATAVTLNSSEPHKIPEYINYITINRSFHVQEPEVRHRALYVRLQWLIYSS